jgi:hypothetical protein
MHENGFKGAWDPFGQSRSVISATHPIAMDKNHTGELPACQNRPTGFIAIYCLITGTAVA